MTRRKEPVLAVWLVKHLVASRRRESLLGDLFEEYQAGRSSGWYWREVVIALYLSLRSSARESFSLRGSRVILAVIAESVLVVWVVMLSQQHREHCLALPVVSSASTLLMLCAGIAQIAIALVVSGNPPSRPARVHRRSGFFRLSLAAFAAIGVSGGALTWASTASCSIHSLSMQSCAPRAGVTPEVRGIVGHPFRLATMTSLD